MDNVEAATSAPAVEDAPPAPPPLPLGVADDGVLHERKRSILVLILRHLHDQGLGQSYQTLCVEAGLSLNQIDVADNVDLNTVVQAYEDYYESKFGRKPRLSRNLPADGQVGPVPGAPGPFPPGVGPFFSSPFSPMYHHAQSVLSPVSSNDGYSGLGSTCRLGSTLSITQEELIQTVGQLPDLDPSHAFSFERPRRNAGTKRSVHLFLSEIQEKILYALVGCSGIGWNIRAITPDTREFLSSRCNINKEMLQLFFKNRSKRPKRERSRKKDVAQPQGMNGGFGALVQQAARPLPHPPQVNFGVQQQAQQQPQIAHHLASQIRPMSMALPMGTQLGAAMPHQPPTLPSPGGVPTSLPRETPHLKVEHSPGAPSLHTPLPNMAHRELGAEVMPMQSQLPPPLMNLQAHTLNSQSLMMQQLMSGTSLDLVTQGTSIEAVAAARAAAAAAAQHTPGPTMVNAQGEGM